MWGFHPRIMQRLVSATIFPLLFYATPVWCSAVQFLARLTPLDRVIRLSGIATMGLLRTVSYEVAVMLAGFLPAEFQIRQRTVEFYLRQLTYGRNLITEEVRYAEPSHATTPLDILDFEVAQLDRHGSLPRHYLQRVETRSFWTVDPTSESWTLVPSILDAEVATQWIRQSRPVSAPDELWIFTDGSVDGMDCGASAVLFFGSSMTRQSYSVRFVGNRSSTQAELVAIILACQKVSTLGRFRRITLVSDSQPALLGIQRRQGITLLACRACDALSTIQTQTDELRLWWTPSHVELEENDQGHEAAKLATRGHPTDGTLIDIPHCYTTLRTKIRRFLFTQVNRQWTNSERGRALYSVMPTFSSSIAWTEGLSRRESALVAQFLIAHYATSSYLHRFGLREDSECVWCGDDGDDWEHRLFECPRFEYTRQRLAMEIEIDLEGAQCWCREFLLTDGRKYLAKFLKAVHGATRSCLEDLDRE